MKLKRLMIATLALLTVVLIVRYGNTEALSFAALKAQREFLYFKVQTAPWQSRAVFFVLFLFISASALPGTGPLSVVAGAIFGIPWGIFLVSFASTLGACLCLVVARFVLRDWALRRFGHRLEWLKRESQDEAWALASMRLIPFVPFFVSNVLMSLTSISLPRFWLVSQISMLPVSFLYVKGGQEFARMTSINDALEPRFLIILFAIAIFPWVARLFLRRSKSE